MKIIKIQGNYHDMGISYGTQCKKDIHNLLRQISYLTRLPNFMKRIFPNIFQIKEAKNHFLTQFTYYIEAIYRKIGRIPRPFDG
jgi:hypothetical protein